MFDQAILFDFADEVVEIVPFYSGHSTETH